MSSAADISEAVAVSGAVVGANEPTAAADERTLAILESRRENPRSRRRGWFVRRVLLGVDGLALAGAVAIGVLVAGPGVEAEHWPDGYGQVLAAAVLVAVWVLVAKLHDLYDHDLERAAHSTVDDLAGIVQTATIAVWLVAVAGSFLPAADVQFESLALTWVLTIALVTVGRLAARAVVRRGLSYVQNTVILGAGDVGQLIARKVLQHPEYGLNLVGFVDAEPRERRDDLAHLTVLGPPEQLPAIIDDLSVERVIVAFSNESSGETVGLIRSLRKVEVHIDIVPRLFDAVDSSAALHAVEGLPLVGLHSIKAARRAHAVKRLIDIAGAVIGLIVAAPFFVYAAWRIKSESPGPVFFRQTRIGKDMCEFSMWKFRTMKVDTDDTPHREYIRSTMTSQAIAPDNGIYKLTREDRITPFGRWLRRTSLDELPQLINVLRGPMSLVGPRPCLSYEIEHFAPHHFDRFLVRPGMTGLWQVTARARSTFGEALDMDAAYARNWSLSLDLRLLAQTPPQLITRRGTA